MPWLSASPVNVRTQHAKRTYIGQWLERAEGLQRRQDPEPAQKDDTTQLTKATLRVEASPSDDEQMIGDICGKPSGNKVGADTRSKENWNKYDMVDYMMDM